MLFRGHQVLLGHFRGIPNSDVVILRMLHQRKRERSFLEEWRACIKVRKTRENGTYQMSHTPQALTTQWNKSRWSSFSTVPHANELVILIMTALDKHAPGCLWPSRAFALIFSLYPLTFSRPLQWTWRLHVKSDCQGEKNLLSELL